MPLSGVVVNGHVCLAYRPTAETRHSNTTRQSVNLIPIAFQDCDGYEKFGCWFAPITLGDFSRDIGGIHSVAHLHNNVQQYVLLLPKLSSDGYVNAYYVLGDKWKHRVRSGKFLTPQIHQPLFEEWLSDDTNTDGET